MVNAGAPSEVTIAVGAGGTLAVRAEGVRGARFLYVMRGEGVVDLLQLEDGLEARAVLPTGRYRIGSVARSPGAVLMSRFDRFDSVHEVEIRAGEVTLLELEP